MIINAIDSRTLASFPFPLTERRGDSIDVEVIGPTDSLSDLVEILDD
jgi:hypothetical protein